MVQPGLDHFIFLVVKSKTGAMGFPDALAAYADRLHTSIGTGHHVASPLGAWLVLALAAPAGLSRAACQAQLAAAVQVVLHVRRSAGRRWLAEIAVLDRDGAGRVVVRAAVRDGVPDPAGWDRLVDILADRGVALPPRAGPVERVDGGPRDAP